MSGSLPIAVGKSKNSAPNNVKNAGGLLEPLVPANANTNLANFRSENFKTCIPWSEIELLLRSIPPLNMALAVDAS